MKKLTSKVLQTQEKLNSKYKKLTKQRPLDHAILYLVQHPELISMEPIHTERLLLCCWYSNHTKNLTMILDMLVESGSIITSEELSDIVLSFIEQGFKCSDNMHKYIEYLCIAKAYKLPIKVWKEYMTQCLSKISKDFSNKEIELDGSESDVSQLLSIFTDIFKNTCPTDGKFKTSPYFEQILEQTFSLLEGYANICNHHVEKTKKLINVIRPFIFIFVTKKVPLYSLLSKNEFFNRFLIDQFMAWSEEDSLFFRALFLKFDFKNHQLPWSVYKGFKDEVKQMEDQSLYLFITKYFMDSFSEDEQLCEYCFTTQEYKDLIKHFLSSNDVVTEKEYEINDNNEAEYLGFVVIEE